MGNFSKITLEKDMYNVPGKSFTQVLEELDDSENYRGTWLENTDAFQRQLIRYGIRVKGSDSSTVESFFSTSAGPVLFPEYVTRAVSRGMECTTRAEDIAATITDVGAVDYRTIDIAEEVAPNVNVLPTVTIRSNERLVPLKKYGRYLTSTYEALRFQKLDLLSVALHQIGAHIAHAQLLDAVGVFANDDNFKIGTLFLASAPNYRDLIGVRSDFSPYRLNTILAGTMATEQILSISEFKDSKAGMDFRDTGVVCTPLGANLIHIPGMENNSIIVLDKNCALEMVRVEGIVTESDKLIDRQFGRAAITATAGFSRIYKGAARGIKCNLREEIV